ncbi:MAG: tetratricopeptide repeat protein [Elusimicrobiota bacterium]
MKKSLFSLLILACLLSPSGLSAATKAAYMHYLKALLLSNQSQYAEALREYEAALELDAQSAFMCQQAAELALGMGRTERALEFAGRFVELSPEDPEAHHLLGSVHWARGDVDRAKAAFEKTLELNPGHQDALLALGNLLSAQSPDTAKKYLRDYIAENPEDASEAEYHIALMEQKAGRVGEAIVGFRRSIEADPGNMHARYALAQLFEMRRDTEAALAEYVGILERDSQNVILLNHVGEIHYIMEDLDSARDMFLRAKSISPADPAACLWLAILAEKAEDFTTAAAYVKDSAALGEDSSLNLRLSYYLTQADLLKDAVRVLEVANGKWPENEDIAYFLALGYDDLKRRVKAIALMKDIIERRPEHRDARFQLGAMYEKGGDIANAELHFRELLRRHPNDASALNYLGYSLADRGLKLDEAEALIRRAVELDPDRGAYVDSLGWIHHKQGRRQEALRELKAAAQLLPDDETIWDHLGDAYRVSEDTASAWESWKMAQSLAPGKVKVERKLAEVEGLFSPRELGARYLALLRRSLGNLASYGGPCVIEGSIGGRAFRFQGILHYKAPWDLSVDVFGPMFVPVFRVALSGREGFEMDPLQLDGVAPDALHESLYGALGFLREYLEGGLFKDRPAEYRKGWRRSRIDTEGASLVLDKARIRLSSVKGAEGKDLRLELSDYRSVAGRWVPATLKLDGGGFSFVFRLHRPSIRFD